MVSKTNIDETTIYVSVKDEVIIWDTITRQVLEEIQKKTGVGQSLEEVMDIIWETTKSILPHDRIGLSFVENDNERVTTHYFRTIYDASTVRLGQNYSSGLANSSLKEILDSGKVRIINNLEHYLKEKPDSAATKLLIEEGVQSSLTIPLKVENRSVGFLFFSSRTANVFLEIHAKKLLAVSGIISQHLEKVWRIRKLKETQNDYLTMLGFVSHEMKSPLASMMTVGTTYLKGYMGEVDPLAEKTMKRMMKISGYLINMVKNYLDLSRLESGEMRFEPKPDLLFREDILNFAIDTVSARAEERGSTFLIKAPEKDIKITGDVDLLRIVAVNLLDNAVKYGDENIEIEIKLEYIKYNKKSNQDTGTNSLVFSVKNKGVGFTKEQSKKLFRRFSRLKQKGTEDRRGTGLGLYLTWWIIQKHNGRILSDSKPGEWAEFTIYL